ncbi:MAG: zeta toxin family protein [Pelagibacteraceae bacterium]|nr:zeta toxin family protein [Pelagibacteraceae bacterium]
MIDFKNFLTEGVYDKHIFKAFFLAGGPGSGKSWVASRTLEGSGMKVINTDLGFERYATKVGLDLKKMSTFSDFQQRQKEFLRQRSKSGTKTQLQHAIDGRLGLILDSTARDIPRIEREKRGLDFTGYDTYMVFVNTTLETALKRNQMRPRSVPDAIVIQSHKQIQANRQKLKNIFGSNYVEVDNDFDLAHINSEVYKKINKLKKPKYSKQMAKDWVAIELEMKKQAGQKKTSVFSLFGRRK